MRINPLQTIDQALGEEVLDLYEPVKKIIDHNDPRPAFDFYKLIPDYYVAGRELEEFLDELTDERKAVDHKELVYKLFPQEERQRAAVARLYMAFGFMLGLRLSGASEEKVKELMNVYSFGLAEPEPEKKTSEAFVEQALRGASNGK